MNRRNCIYYVHMYAINMLLNKYTPLLSYVPFSRFFLTLTLPPTLNLRILRRRQILGNFFSSRANNGFRSWRFFEAVGGNSGVENRVKSWAIFSN